MLKSLTREMARSIDRRAVEEFGLPSVVLMENAGRGVAGIMTSIGLRSPIVICCGPGNNGGDGLVVARHLDLRKVDVRVLVWGDRSRFSADTAANCRAVEQSGIPIQYFGDVFDEQALTAALDGANTIVDALLGTGASGEPRAPLDRVIDQLNAHPAAILAIDVPSGLDSDTGQAARHTIRARHTCTFVARKAGLLAEGAEAYTGFVHLVDIGAPRKLIEDVLGA